jgi:hypothetical protein
MKRTEKQPEKQPQEERTINDLSLLELKAASYDILLQREQLNAVYAQIQARIEQLSKN